MKFKEYLKKMIKEKRAKMAEMQKRSDESEDLAEVRSIGKALQELRDEITEAEEQLKKLDESDEGNGEEKEEQDKEKEEQDKEEEGRSRAFERAEKRNFWAAGSFLQKGTERSGKMNTDRHDTPEYRSAFMEYVCRGIPIPTELRSDEVTGATDAQAVIPTTILNEIVREMNTYGNVYKLVRKLNVQGGVSIPIMSIKPKANWVGEGSGDDQKLTANESVTFNYYGVECKIAQSLLVNVTTLAAFQQLFVEIATEAIVEALDITIFNGNGTNQMLGILKDTRVSADNVITLTPSEFNDWGAWHKKVKAKMKKAYRDGTFFMNQSTFDGYIDGMTDKNGQPVGRTNYGINGEENYRFMGKSVETVEDGCLTSFDDAGTGDVVAVFLKPTDYAINTNMQMTTVKWTDNDTNEVKNKCIMICDGKLVDTNGVLIIKKGAEA